MYPTFPAGHPPSHEEVVLGQLLFADPSLSRDGTVSCATCHDPRYAFTDRKALSPGVGGVTRRNTPTVLNAAFFDHLAWDGEHDSLETQSLAAISNPIEMGLELTLVPGRVQGKHGNELRRLYGEVTPSAVAKALAAFQRTLLVANSPFDRYLFAGEADAINPAARRGFKIFLRHGRCIQCHTMRCDECHPFGGSTAFLTNDRFHNLGIGFDRNGGIPDQGRAEVTQREQDRGSFKTPSLRNVALTAPYMHDGSLATLEEVIDHYDKGGIPNPYLDPEIHPLHLSAREKEDLVEFLKSLTSRELLDQLPQTTNGGGR
jgi:cytochrome c peroxidase